MPGRIAFIDESKARYLSDKLCKEYIRQEYMMGAAASKMPIQRSFLSCMPKNEYMVTIERGMKLEKRKKTKKNIIGI